MDTTVEDFIESKKALRKLMRNVKPEPFHHPDCKYHDEFERQLDSEQNVIVPPDAKRDKANLEKRKEACNCTALEHICPAPILKEK